MVTRRRVTIAKVSRLHAAALTLEATRDFVTNEHVRKAVQRVLRDVDELYTLAEDYPRIEE